MTCEDEKVIETCEVLETRKVGSKRFSLGKRDWKSVAVGLAINIVGQIFVWTPHLLGYIPDPKIAAFLSMISPGLVNIGKKFISDTEGFEVILKRKDDEDEPESTAVKQL